MGTSGARWYRSFRRASYFAVVVGIVWTVAFILPWQPFDGLLPILIGGGAGEWLLLGYVLYISAGVCGFMALTSMIATVELQEKRVLDSRFMGVGLLFFYFGATATCLLLAYAGGLGGYAQGHVTGVSLQATLDPFLSVTRITAALGAAGALICMLGIRLAKAGPPSE